MFNSLEYSSPSSIKRMLQKLGVLNHSNLFWSWYEPRNFGDWIGPYLFKAITGKAPVYCEASPRPPCTTYMSAGSIMRKIVRPDTSIVWGSGIISKQDIFAKPQKILAVRGPHTKLRCDQLGFNCPEIYGDPAILMPLYYNPPSNKKSFRLGIIPHFVDYEFVHAKFSHLEDTLIVDVTRQIEDVIADINLCDATVSSSLHGLIISHSYGISSAWVSFSENLEGDDIKFLDYLSAGGVNITTPYVPNNSWKTNDFLSLCADSQIPNNEALRLPLLAVCPFKKAYS